MTDQGIIPLTPEQVEARRNTAELSRSRKRDALEGRLFEPTGYTPDIPEPTAREIASALSRLKGWLTREGITFSPGIIEQIASSSAPWTVVRQQLQGTGSTVTIETIQTAVTSLHEDTFRLSYATRSQRAILGPVADPAGRDDTSEYRQEHQRLTSDHGMSDSQAHQLMAEWGWENPLYSQGELISRGLMQLAEGLAIARATGEYTGPLEPEDLLSQPTLQSALQLLEDTYSGPKSFDDFSSETQIEGVEGISDDPEEAADQAEAAEQGKPIIEEVFEPELRRPIGVPLDYVARAAPRAPGKLRGQAAAGQNRPGLPLDDAEAFIASGPRGEDLAFAGRGRIEQPPEYFEGDDTNIFNGLSFEQTVLYQTMLVDAGFLSPEDFAIEQGQKNGGFATWDAMGRAMWSANATIATSWIEAAQDAAATRARNNAAVAGTNVEPVPVWTPATYLAPDPDRLAQIVKSAFRSQLGREPTAGEVSSLMASLAGEFRGAFGVGEQIDKAAFTQGIAAQEASLGPIDPQTGERVVEPLAEGETFRTVDNPLGSVTEVDPISSFQELFEARFAEEMARGRQRVTQRDARSDIMSSIFAIDAAVGGGR